MVEDHGMMHPRVALLPLKTFRRAACYQRNDWEPDVIGLMIGSYMAGDPNKPSARELNQWFRDPTALSRSKKASLYEFISQWLTPDCQTYYLSGGNTLYEIAHTMHEVHITHFHPVNFINRYSSEYHRPKPSGLDYAGWGRLTEAGLSYQNIKRGISAPSRPPRRIKHNLS